MVRDSLGPPPRWPEPTRLEECCKLRGIITCLNFFPTSSQSKLSHSMQYPALRIYSSHWHQSEILHQESKTTLQFWEILQQTQENICWTAFFHTSPREPDGRLTYIPQLHFRNIHNFAPPASKELEKAMTLFHQDVTLRRAKYLKQSQTSSPTTWC